MAFYAYTSSIMMCLSTVFSACGSTRHEPTLSTEADTVSSQRHDAQYLATELLGLSMESIAALDIDQEVLTRGMAALKATDPGTIRSILDNAAQLQRRRAELAEAEAAGKDVDPLVTLEIRSRSEGAVIMRQHCREIVFGENASSYSFKMMAGDIAPWDRLPAPYRTPAVSLELAHKLLENIQQNMCADATISAPPVSKTDSVYNQIDSIPQVIETRQRIRDRLSSISDLFSNFLISIQSRSLLP